MTGKTMAEVLAGHGLLSHGRTGTYACSDPDCGWEFRYRSRMDDLRRGVDVVAREFAAHQADMLAAAGFGDERETAERVWDECERAQYVISLNPKGTAWEALKTNPYRAAAVRGEG